MIINIIQNQKKAMFLLKNLRNFKKQETCYSPNTQSFIMVEMLSVIFLSFKTKVKIDSVVDILPKKV